MDKSVSIYKYPLENQRKMFNALKSKKEHLNNSWLAIPERFFSLIKFFIEHKKKYGSLTEKKYYENSTIDSMLSKLYKKRPLVFVGSADS